MKIKVFSALLLCLASTLGFSNNIPANVQGTSTQVLISNDDCDIPAPSTFHLTESSSTWARFDWTPEWLIPPTYRLKTYEVATGNLINTLDVPGGFTMARVQNLTGGVNYRTDIFAVCSDGKENPSFESVDFITPIQELVVTGFSSSATPPICAITTAGQVCPLFLGSGYVNVYQFESRYLNTSYTRKFYVDRLNASTLRVRIFSGDNNTGVAFQCKSYNNTYNWPVPSCEAIEYSIVVEGFELCRFELVGQGSTAGYLKCNFMATNGKNTIYLVSNPSLSGEPDDRAQILEKEYLISSTTVTPNPFSNQLDIQLPDSDANIPVGMHLYDLQGRVVISKNVESGQRSCTLNTEALLPGMYFLRVETGGVATTVKVIKTQ